MKKFNIELTEEQMQLVANCMEDICRFASGQVEMGNTIVKVANNVNDKLNAESKLIEVKKILFPNLAYGASYGYNHTPFIGNTYQIYRTIKHYLLKDTDTWNVYHSPALPSGDMGTIKITEIKEEFKKL